MKTLLLFAIICASVVHAADRTDEATGLVFPQDISRWIFNDFEAYEPKELGVSYSYKSKLNRVGAITCYVYNKGLSSIPTGGDSAVVANEMKEVVWAVGEGWKRMDAKVQPAVPVSALKSEDGRTIALYCVHRITKDGMTQISVSALTGYKDNFLKVRFTFPSKDVHNALAGLGGIIEFATEMRALNKDHLDPLFLAPKPIAKPLPKT